VRGRVPFLHCWAHRPSGPIDALALWVPIRCARPCNLAVEPLSMILLTHTAQSLAMVDDLGRNHRILPDVLD
jgi:hypothetical protein